MAWAGRLDLDLDLQASLTLSIDLDLNVALTVAHHERGRLVDFPSTQEVDDHLVLSRRQGHLGRELAVRTDGEGSGHLPRGDVADGQELDPRDRRPGKDVDDVGRGLHQVVASARDPGDLRAGGGLPQRLRTQAEGVNEDAALGSHAGGVQRDVEVAGLHPVASAVRQGRKAVGEQEADLSRIGTGRACGALEVQELPHGQSDARRHVRAPVRTPGEDPQEGRPDRPLIEREWLDDQGIGGPGAARGLEGLGEGHHANPCARAVDLGQEVERRRHFRTENRFPRERLGKTDDAAAHAPPADAAQHAARGCRRAPRRIDDQHDIEPRRRLALGPARPPGDGDPRLALDRGAGLGAREVHLRLPLPPRRGPRPDERERNQPSAHRPPHPPAAAVPSGTSGARLKRSSSSS